MEFLLVLSCRRSLPRSVVKFGVFPQASKPKQVQAIAFSANRPSPPGSSPLYNCTLYPCTLPLSLPTGPPSLPWPYFTLPYPYEYPSFIVFHRRSNEASTEGPESRPCCRYMLLYPSRPLPWFIRSRSGMIPEYSLKVLPLGCNLSMTPMIKQHCSKVIRAKQRCRGRCGCCFFHRLTRVTSNELGPTCSRSLHVVL